MLKNYIKTAWRNLLKNKFYSLVNVTGLTLGLCIGILILIWVQDELSFDTFHKKTPDIYYAYRIDIAWWMFVAAGIIAVFIAFTTISFQTIKAALMNPVKSLRSE